MSRRLEYQSFSHLLITCSHILIIRFFCALFLWMCNYFFNFGRLIFVTTIISRVARIIFGFRITIIRIRFLLLFIFTFLFGFNIVTRTATLTVSINSTVAFFFIDIFNVSNTCVTRLILFAF